jgi:hypothetical protein
MYKRLWRRPFLSIGAPFGKVAEGSSTGDFEICLKGALKVECLSLWEICEGNL